jgi:hypothetical protein
VLYDARWQDTFFVAAVDGCSTLWEHDHADKVDRSTPCRRTQRRWIEQAAKLLGLVKELPQRMADEVCQELGIGGLEHRKARGAWAEARDIRSRSRAVLSILALLVIDGHVYRRVLASGHITGSLATGYIWDCERSRRLFPALGTSRGYGDRSPP